MERGVSNLGEMIFELELKKLMKERLGKGSNLDELLPTMVLFHVTMLGTVVPVSQGQM